MKLPSGFSSRHLKRSNIQDILLPNAAEWGIELWDDIPEDCQLQFHHSTRFQAGINYPMWILKGIRTTRLVADVIIYYDFDSGFNYWINAQDVTILPLRPKINIKGVTLLRKQKTNDIIYEPIKR